MHAHRKKKALRAAFVVTVSAASLACGGAVDHVGGSSGDGGDVGPGVGSHNPPARSVPVACTPDATALAGEPCATEGETCAPTNCGPSWQCDGGTWKGIATAEPCKEPFECPASAPAVGSFCSPLGASCAYPDACGSRPKGAPSDRTFSCVANQWQADPAPYAAACPATPPTNGASCASCAGAWPSDCSYTTNEGCPPAHASCDPKTETWRVSVSTCNPPAIDAGSP